MQCVQWEVCLLHYLKYLFSHFKVLKSHKKTKQAHSLVHLIHLVEKKNTEKNVKNSVKAESDGSSTPDQCTSGQERHGHLAETPAETSIVKNL